MSRARTSRDFFDELRQQWQTSWPHRHYIIFCDSVNCATLGRRTQLLCRCLLPRRINMRCCASALQHPHALMHSITFNGVQPFLHSLAPCHLAQIPEHTIQIQPSSTRRLEIKRPTWKLQKLHKPLRWTCLLQNCS